MNLIYEAYMVFYELVLQIIVYTGICNNYTQNGLWAVFRDNHTTHSSKLSKVLPVAGVLLYQELLWWCHRSEWSCSCISQQ